MGFRDSLRASHCLRIPNEKPERPLALASFWPHLPAQAPLGRRGRPKKTATSVAGFLFLVIPARFERATVCLEGRCSIQLSYGTEGAKIGRELEGMPSEREKVLDSVTCFHDVCTIDTFRFVYGAIRAVCIFDHWVCSIKSHLVGGRCLFGLQSLH